MPLRRDPILLTSAQDGPLQGELLSCGACTGCVFLVYIPAGQATPHLQCTQCAVSYALTAEVGHSQAGEDT